MGSGGMKLLIIALSLIAAIYTVVAAFLAIAWWYSYSKVPFYDMLPLVLYFVPIGALCVSCAALWKITKRPER
jgi:hypothetical protein